MRKIYENLEFTRVGHYQSVLEAAGIKTWVNNLGASFLAGEIPQWEVCPELWVVNDADYDTALEILRPLHHPDLPTAPDWTCPHCGETVPGSLGECWNCRTPEPDR